jgi:hypothetical protein
VTTRAKTTQRSGNPFSVQSFQRVLLFAAALSVGAPAQAMVQDHQLWTTVFVNVKLSTKWKLSDDVTARFSDNKHGLYEIENNLLLGYALTPKITAWAGYTHDPQYSAGHFTVMEHRAREQVTFAKLATFAGGTFDARFRMEQRWRAGVAGTGWRIRPFIRYSLPFTKSGKTVLIVSHESFVDLNTTGFQKNDGYDRMRNFVGITTPLTKFSKLELGYLNQWAIVRGGPDTMDHVAVFSIGRLF